VTTRAGVAASGSRSHKTGVAVGDIDNDGFLDLYVTALGPNILFRNKADGRCTDVTAAAGVAGPATEWSTSTGFFDYDGDLDLYVTNGHVIDNLQLYQPTHTYAQKDLLFENLGGKFRDISAQSGPALKVDGVGRGLAVADFANDGNLDVAISSVGMKPVLLRNQGVRAGNWITLRAAGKGSNRFGLGAIVRIEAGGKTQVGEINNVASYERSNDIRCTPASAPPRRSRGSRCAGRAA
jgi:enediyne biosynthesis protein E4